MLAFVHLDEPMSSRRGNTSEVISASQATVKTVHATGSPDEFGLTPVCTPSVSDFPARSGHGSVEADMLRLCRSHDALNSLDRGTWRCIVTRTTSLSTNSNLRIWSVIATFWIIELCRRITTSTSTTRSRYSLWGTCTVFCAAWVVGTWALYHNLDIDAPVNVLELWDFHGLLRI